MKRFYKFPALATLFLAFAFTGCDKTSDIVTPQESSATHTSYAVGDSWEQGPAVTGLTCPVLLTLTSTVSTGNGGTIGKWAGTTSCPPAETLTYTAVYTNEAGQTFKYSTLSQPTGEVTMTTQYFPNKKK